MWQLRYQNDTMEDYEVIQQFDGKDGEDNARKELIKKSREIKSEGRFVNWLGMNSFNYRNFNNQYTINYWVERVR
jgi:hypothetical protein